MLTELLTKQDLHQFKTELMQELSAIISTQAPPKKWLRTSEVNKLLKLSPGTLQTLRVNGTLQYSRIGNIIYYDHDHIQKLLEKNLVKSSTI